MRLPNLPETDQAHSRVAPIKKLEQRPLRTARTLKSCQLTTFSLFLTVAATSTREQTDRGICDLSSINRGFCDHLPWNL
jgi:hypothetical protein